MEARVARAAAEKLGDELTERFEALQAEAAVAERQAFAAAAEARYLEKRLAEPKRLSAPPTLVVSIMG